jgi:hypothetical protein
MKTDNLLLSDTRINRLKAQGYCNISDAELSALAFGNRFAYFVCVTILAIGVALTSIPILIAMITIAFFGIILPYHPLDYIYNHAVRHMLGKPKLPRRSKQLKFACTVATIWISGVIYLFYSDFLIAGYVAGGLLGSVALLVATTDFCIPSTIYNFIFKVKIET